MARTQLGGTLAVLEALSVAFEGKKGGKKAQKALKRRIKELSGDA